MAASDIVIKGAREHNLRDVDLTLPRNRLICLTGVSGAGQSSPAFDTLSPDGQGRVPECHRPITAQTREQIIDRIQALPQGTRFVVLAPVVRAQKGEYRD